MTIPYQDELLTLIRDLHAQIRDAVVAACERQAIEDLSGVAEDDEPGDTIYAVDRVGEAVLVRFFAERVAPRWPLVLVGEGLPAGRVLLPQGAAEADATIRVIVDPIDGTRGLMYQKRPAWVLTGVAPNRGPATSLRDIALAVQTEIPLVKQHLCDTLWASADTPTAAERLNRLTGERTPLRLRPSQAPSIAHGFATVSRFFPGPRAELAAIDDGVARAALGPPQPGKAQCFEDQYISTGGQLYELIAGHDRFIADLRPLLDRRRAPGAEAVGICCHPYDLCTALVARQAGVILSDGAGAELDAPLDIHADVAWAGFANQAIRDQVEPPLLGALRARGLIG